MKKRRPVQNVSFVSHVSCPHLLIIGIATPEVPQKSFLEVGGEVEGEQLEEDPDRGSLKGFMDKTQGELTYLMVAPSNPLPPREQLFDEMLQPPAFDGMQLNTEDAYNQPRQKATCAKPIYRGHRHLQTTIHLQCHRRQLWPSATLILLELSLSSNLSLKPRSRNGLQPSKTPRPLQQRKK